MTTISRRQILAGVAAGLMTASLGVAATPGAATAATGQGIRPCALRPLAFPADAYRATADAIDPTGRFIAGSGRRHTTGGATEPLLLVWDEGRLTSVASPLVKEIADVNADGAVIGNGWVNGVSQPWRYRAGQLESLPTGTFSYVGVAAINGSGNVVGFGYSPPASRWRCSGPPPDRARSRCWTRRPTRPRRTSPTTARSPAPPATSEPGPAGCAARPARSSR